MSIVRRCLTICVCLLAATSLTQAAVAPVILTKVGSAPVIDGNLSDAVWTKATRLTGFVLYDKEAPAQTQTTVLTCYDDLAWYIAVICQEPDTDKLVAKVENDDGPVSQDDCVELFIIPGSGGEYYHFIVNSIGTRLDQRSWGQARARDNHWEGDWQSAVRMIKGKEWVVELAIPWYNFGGDLGSGRWAFNVCRAKRTEPAEFSALSFPAGNFHNIFRFARLQPPAIDFSRFLPGLGLREVSVPSYQAGPQGYSYVVEGKLWYPGDRAREVCVRVQDRPAVGQGESARAQVTLVPRQETPFAVTVPFAAAGERTLKLWLEDSASGKTVYVTAFAPDLLPQLMEAYLDRNYYTHEKGARGIFSLNLPKGRGRFRARVEVAIGSGKPVTVQAPMGNHERTVVKVPLARIPLGTHPVKLKVLDGKNRIVAERDWELRKEKPAPAGVREVKVDHERMIALVDGKPFFTIGMFGVPEYFFKSFADLGVNFTQRWGGHGGNPMVERAKGSAEERQKIFLDFYDAAQDAGLMVMEYPVCFSSAYLVFGPTFQENFAIFAQKDLPFIAETVMGQPALLGYYGIDEPNWRHVEECQKYLEVVRSVDPYHPVAICSCPNVNHGAWPRAFDIAGVDYYLKVLQPISSVYSVAAKESQLIHGQRAPYWPTVMLEAGSGGPPSFTGPMQLAQSYLTVIGGANGIIWWIWPPRYHSNWEAIQQLCREFSQLTPILVESSPKYSVKYPNFATRDTVKALIKNHAGKTYLITCNGAYSAGEATFVLPQQYAGTARVLFEDRALEIRNGKFTDHFAAYGRHIYELKGTWPARADLTLEVAMKESAEKAPETPLPQLPNLISDPGFEDGSDWQFTVAKEEEHSRVTGQIVQADVASGVRAAKIQSPYPLIYPGLAGSARFLGKKIALKPNTRYLFGLSMKVAGGQTKAFLDSGSGIYGAYINFVRYMRTMLIAEDRVGWRRHSITFQTDDEAISVVPTCWLEGEGTALFDDLFLMELGPSSKNMVKNSGFEMDMPDFPGCPADWSPVQSIQDLGFMGTEAQDDDSLWMPDTKEVYEGKRSLRMRNAPGHHLDSYRGVELLQHIGTVAAGDYTLSMYLKADRPDTKLHPYLAGYRGPTLTVTNEWKRYVMPLHFDSESWLTIHLFLQSQGTLWMDAMQLERGSEATPYQEGQTGWNWYAH